MAIFCRKVIVSNPEVLKEKGPLLLACNHPNSFLDAVILDMLFDQPVWSLARGDVFKSRTIRRILHSLKIMPLFRTSEGAEYLSENYRTFDSCLRIFKNNGIISIFSEGKCINEWHLRSLKKGTARLAIKSWDENIPLRVLPLGINYSSFGRFGKNIYINIGPEITMSDIDLGAADGVKFQSFNQQLNRALQQLVFEIPKENKKLQEEKLAVKTSAVKKMILALPAIPGYLLHFPLYAPIRYFTWTKLKASDHYDSVLVALLLFTYPLYLLLITLIAWSVTKSWYAFSLLLLLPFCAWAYVQVKPQLDK
jgi:1-acyl-sn-glycerol-3-phosphate acyltransferase